MPNRELLKRFFLTRVKRKDNFQFIVLKDLYVGLNLYEKSMLNKRKII